MDKDIYKFGPSGDIEFAVSLTVEDEFSNYNMWPWQLQLEIQIMAHAMLQLKLWPPLSQRNEKRSGRLTWELRYTDWNNRYVYEVKDNGKEKVIVKVRKSDSLAFGIYDLIYEDRLVLALEEQLDGYRILHMDPVLIDECFDMVTDKALEHVNSFGRCG